MRSTLLAAFVTPVLLVSVGCETPASAPAPVSSSPPSAAPVTTVDGLVEAQLDLPGKLFLREGHGIGSYDAFLIAPVSFSYTRRSRQLTPEMEALYAATLEQSLFDAAEAARIPTVEEPGACVMQIGIGFVNVDLPRSRSARTPGRPAGWCS